ncbi:TPA: hypothetical protein ACGWVL_003013 [Pseudomonas aeruginosa]|nr:hypothetical protein [Pseudomonas sp. On1]MDX2309915.1 hypothetical protein [Pseudomonas sp. On1]
MDLVQLLEAIRSYYGDTSRTREATREGLEEAQSEIETLIDSLAD